MDNNRTRYLDVAYVILRDILKNWITIVCVVLSAALLTHIVAAMGYAPKYRSRCTMIVSAKVNSQGVYTDTSETEKLTNTINAVLNSNVLKKKTAEALDMKSFDGVVAISILPQTNLLEVSVSSSDPSTAFMLLSKMLELYPEVSKDILGDIVMNVYEKPLFSLAPYNVLNTRKATNLAMLIAAGVMILLFAVYSYFRETVKNKWDASDKLDAKLLGVIYHESSYRNPKAFLLRKKKRLLIGAPAVSFNFSETVKKIRTNLSYQQEKSQSKVLLVTSYDKKEGKSLVAANLASAMAQRKQKVLIMSGTKDCAKLVELMGMVPDEEFLSKPKAGLADWVYSRKDGYLNVLIYPEFASAVAFTNFIYSDEYKEFLNKAKETYDNVIIDGPPTKNHADTEVLAGMVDYSLLVVKQNYSRVPLLNDTIDMLNGYGAGLAGIVFNDVYSSSTVINFGYGYGYGNGYGYGYGYGGYGGYGYGKYKRYGRYNYSHYNHYDKSHSKQKAKRYK